MVKMLLLSFGTRHDRPKAKILLKLFFIKSLKFCDTRSPFAVEKQEYLVFYASGELPFIKHPTEHQTVLIFAMVSQHVSQH